MWIARDENDFLWLFKNKPKKRPEFGIWDSHDVCMERIETLSYCFHDVKWSDEEPTEVKLVKK